MTPRIPAVLLWRDAPTAPPVQHPTDAPPHMCSPVAEAAAFLLADKPAMVAAGDIAALLRALEQQEARE